MAKRKRKKNIVRDVVDEYTSALVKNIVTRAVNSLVMESLKADVRYVKQR